MADDKRRIIFQDIRGGINGIDPPWAIADNEVVDAVNIDLYGTRLGHKRNGTATSGVAFGTTLDTTIHLLHRHVPGTSEAAAELWGIDADQIGRMAATTTFVNVTLKDAIAGTNAWDWDCCSIRGGIVFAYSSAQTRAHLWDGSTVRRAGLAASGAPTAANTGAGIYAAVLRYYRQRSTRQSGGITLGRSEPSASVSFTPSATGASARVTQATVINEGETHWEVEASIDNVTFYRIATVAIGTTIYDDSAATTSYNSNPLSAATGFYTLQKSYRFVRADQNRVLGYGSWTSTDKQNRIEYSAVIGSSDVGDEERVDTTTNYFNDLDENDSGPPTGLGGPVMGLFFAFKRRQTWLGTPTGQTSQPYRWDKISASIGCVSHKSIAVGEDEDGNPALYWQSHRGPYRWTLKGGVEYIGRGIEHLILGPTDTLAYRTNGASAFSLYYPDKRQWVMWYASTNQIAAFAYNVLWYHVESGGWTRQPASDQIGPSLAVAACLFSNTIGATMSQDLKPYYSKFVTLSLTGSILKGDTGNNDEAAGYRAYVDTRAYEPGGAGYYGEIGDAVLMAAASSGTTITLTAIADFGIQTKAATVLLTPSASETRVTKRVEDSALAGDVIFVQHRYGDAAATTSAWNIDRLIVPRRQQDPVGA